MQNESYEPYTAKVQADEVKQRHQGKTYEQVVDDMRSRFEYSLELDNLKPQTHNWVDRGLKMTCEGSTHSYHEAWKQRRQYS